MAVEPWTLIDTILILKLRHFLRCVPTRQKFDIFAALAGADAFHACAVFGRRLRVEGDAFEFLAALVAAEAFGVETAPAGAHDATADGERAVGALGTGADGSWGPVGAGGRRCGSGRVRRAGVCADGWC